MKGLLYVEVLQGGQSSFHIQTTGLGGTSVKVGSTAKFGVAVFKASILDSAEGRGPLAKVGSSAKFGVAVFKAYILHYLGGSIGHRRFVCQVWFSSIYS